MMSLEDLKKFDLKSIDINKAAALLLEKKEILAQVVVLAVSVLMLVGLLSGAHARTQQYRQEIDELHAKSGVMQSYENGLKKMESFLAGLPGELDEEQFSSLIADLAAQNNVGIVSFSPGQKISENFSDTLSARVVVRAGAYKNLLYFIKAMEDDPHSLRIDACSLSVTSNPGRRGGDDRAIEAQIEIASVRVKK